MSEKRIPIEEVKEGQSIRVHNPYITEDNQTIVVHQVSSSCIWSKYEGFPDSHFWYFLQGEK